MRLIDADILDTSLTALRFTEAGKLAHWGDMKEWCLHVSEIERLIISAPTIDAVPVKHGRWIDPASEDCYRCSVCEEYTHMEMPRLLYHYCPNCGAKMDEGLCRDVSNDSYCSADIEFKDDITMDLGDNSK